MNTEPLISERRVPERLPAYFKSSTYSQALFSRELPFTVTKPVTNPAIDFPRKESLMRARKRTSPAIIHTLFQTASICGKAPRTWPPDSSDLILELQSDKQDHVA